MDHIIWKLVVPRGLPVVVDIPGAIGEQLNALKRELTKRGGAISISTTRKYIATLTVAEEAHSSVSATYMYRNTRDDSLFLRTTRLVVERFLSLITLATQYNAIAQLQITQGRHQDAATALSICAVVIDMALELHVHVLQDVVALSTEQQAITMRSLDESRLLLRRDLMECHAQECVVAVLGKLDKHHELRTRIMYWISTKYQKIAQTARTHSDESLRAFASLHAKIWRARAYYKSAEIILETVFSYSMDEKLAMAPGALNAEMGLGILRIRVAREQIVKSKQYSQDSPAAVHESILKRIDTLVAEISTSCTRYEVKVQQEMGLYSYGEFQQIEPEKLESKHNTPEIIRAAFRSECETIVSDTEEECPSGFQFNFPLMYRALSRAITVGDYEASALFRVAVSLGIAHERLLWLECKNVHFSEAQDARDKEIVACREAIAEGDRLMKSIQERK